MTKKATEEESAKTITLPLETARHLFDLAINTPLLCSGNFDTDDIKTLRALAEQIGVDPREATPEEFVSDFPHAFMHANYKSERRTRQNELGYWTVHWETPSETLGRVGEYDTVHCIQGSGNRRCWRTADDPIHYQQADKERNR